MKELFGDGPPDVVGWELDEAERAFEGFPYALRIRTIGEDDSGSLRVIRQVRSGEAVILTCAPESWNVERPKKG